MTQPYERKKKLIDTSLQLRMIGVFLCVSIAASLFQLMLMNQAMLSLSQEFSAEGGKILSRTSDILTRNVLWTAAVLLPMTLLVGLLITHRVAGPAYRLREHCRAIARGERPGPCSLRQLDELQELCAAMNEAFEVAFQASARPEAGAAPSDTDAPTLVRATKKEEEAEASSSCEG